MAVAEPIPASAETPAPPETGGTLTIDLAAIEANWRTLSHKTLTVECGAVVTVRTIVLADERDFTVGTSDFPVTSTVTNDLFHACASRGITFVDTSETFLKFAQQESRLSRAGRLSTPFAFHPVHPQFQVDPDSGNQSSNAAGAITAQDMTIRLEVDRAGTQFAVVQGPNLDQEFSSPPDDADIMTVVHREDAALAAKMCGA